VESVWSSVSIEEFDTTELSLFCTHWKVLPGPPSAVQIKVILFPAICVEIVALYGATVGVWKRIMIVTHI